MARLRSAGAGQVSFALIARAADKYVAPHTPGGGSLGAHVVLSHICSWLPVFFARSRRRQLATMLLDYEPSPSKQVQTT